MDARNDKISRMINQLARGFFLICALAAPDFGELSRAACAAGLSVQLDPASGTYTISAAASAWTFSGTIGQMPQDMNGERGRDSIGNYQEIVFHWTQNKIGLTGLIRAYADTPAALFTLRYDDAAPAPVTAFPNLTSLPAGLHGFSYTNKAFCPPAFATAQTSTPWLLFDDSCHAAIISPASHFLVARLTGDASHVASELNPQLAPVPAGFSQQTLLVVDSGINRAWDAWGNALTNLEGKTHGAADNDPCLKYLGYWTDNGTYYYYNYDRDKGYEGTLLALADHWREARIPVRYLQLDSWWYYKSFTDANGKIGRTKNSKLPAGEWNRYGGLLEYTAHTAVFPNGLAAFQSKLGLPLITHNRWIDPASPYHQDYNISGVAAIDPAWWTNIVSYLKSSGVVTYEQDWLSTISQYSPAMARTPDIGERFFDSMAAACRDGGLTMQYCMPLPSEMLQGSRYDQLTTARVSDDRFKRDRWHDFLYVSRLARSLGIYPWTDGFMSTETPNLLLCDLSAGMVGFGDERGKESKENLLRAVRPDGLIVKPDAPIVPIDADYLAEARHQATPLVAATYTDHDGLRTAYVFAFGATPATVRLAPADFGVTQPAYVYDYFTGQGQRVEGGSAMDGKLNTDRWAYYQIAPIGVSGIAFLGDEDKFVSTGKQRIASIKDEPGKLTAQVLFAAGEGPVRVHGFAAAAPAVAVDGGTAGAVAYDAASGLFTVDISSPSDQAVNVGLSAR
jgi:hypothetical protein